MAVQTATRSAANAATGSAIDKLATIVSAQATLINALLAKLDADAGVTDTDYASELGTLDTLTLR